jgi:heme/copper-type cytochrome/quinol oxidase subunit 1
MMLAKDISCGPGLTCPKIFGYLTIVMAAVIFIGSIYLLLSAVFGIRMGYLVLAVAFFGWMTLWSMIWVAGAHLGLPGVTTPVNQGPRGVDPHWQVVSAGATLTSAPYQVVFKYPSEPWRDLTKNAPSSVQEVQSAVQEYLATKANEEHGVEPEAVNAIQTTDFVVENVRFTSQGRTSLAKAQGFYSNGGPTISLVLRHDSGDVPVYSWGFFLASLFGLAVHIPFLDRAERKRKAVLTGGTRPQWLGPA